MFKSIKLEKLVTFSNSCGILSIINSYTFLSKLEQSLIHLNNINRASWLKYLLLNNSNINLILSL